MPFVPGYTYWTYVFLKRITCVAEEYLPSFKLSVNDFLNFLVYLC